MDSKSRSLTILDGGMGQELFTRFPGEASGLWSAQALAGGPDLVRSLHADFLAAGADIITTNSYMLHRDRLAFFGMEDRFERLQERAARAAVAARDGHGSGLIAGSMGPTGQSYRPDRAPDESIAAERFAEIARLQAPYVDLFLCETMSSVRQARGAVMGARVEKKPVWLSVTVDDDDGTRLRSGEPISNILDVCEEFAIDTLLVNCSPPEAVSEAVAVLSGKGLDIGAYANGFVRISKAFLKPNATVSVLEKRSDLNP